jgi:hypothetical protein
MTFQTMVHSAVCSLYQTNITNCSFPLLVKCYSVLNKLTNTLSMQAACTGTGMSII